MQNSIGISTSQEGKRAFHFLQGCLFVQGLSGFSGGLGLIWDPTGNTLQIPIEWLSGTPFQTYLVPGILLFLVIGILPLVTLYGTWKRRAWAWPATVIISAGLIIWILVEILMIGFYINPPLQAIYGVMGILMLSLSLNQSVKEQF